MEKVITEQKRATVTVSWEHDGQLIIENAKTLGKYAQLCEENYHRERPYMFYAFNVKQFEEGKKALQRKGWLNEGEKLISVGYGGYSTERGYRKWCEECDNFVREIRENCDINEVYWYEYNNHESFISWDGDMGAINKIISIWGEEKAREIHRFSPVYSIDELIKDMTKKNN